MELHRVNVLYFLSIYNLCCPVAPDTNILLILILKILLYFVLLLLLFLPGMGTDIAGICCTLSPAICKSTRQKHECTQIIQKQ